MNLRSLAEQRAVRSGPIRVALIGAGKFASMFLAQVPTMAGLVVTRIADLDPEAARGRTAGLGWTAEAVAATAFVADGEDVATADDVDIVVEATGDPVAGVRHALAAIAANKHLVMVNVEADVLAGPVLAARARKAGLVYSMAYGDQPALIAEQVDWARACGFAIVAAGKGTKYLPHYHRSTPDTVWDHFGLTAAEARKAGMNNQMFNSFIDGTKSAIEMAAVANACRLDVPSGGLAFPPAGVGALSSVLRPRADGGLLERAGMVEVVSSLERDGSQIADDLRWGVYVVLAAPNAYTASCFRQYGLDVDATGRYAAMYRPFHLIGLELAVSVYSAMLRGEATGSPVAFRGDVAAVAKRDLKAGDRLDGEGGYTVWGRLTPAADSLRAGMLPIGMAKGAAMTRDVAAGSVLTFADVEGGPNADVATLRAELGVSFGSDQQR